MIPKFSKPIVLDYRAENIISNILFRLLYKNFKDAVIPYSDYRDEPHRIISNFVSTLLRLKDLDHCFKDFKGNILVNFPTTANATKYTRFPIITFADSYPILPSRICINKEELKIVEHCFYSSISTRIGAIDPDHNILGLNELHMDFDHNRLTRKDYKLFMETLLGVICLSIYMYENY